MNDDRLYVAALMALAVLIAVAALTYERRLLRRWAAEAREYDRRRSGGANAASPRADSHPPSPLPSPPPWRTARRGMR